MNKTLIIARREFLMTVRRKAYLLSLIGIPLLILIIGGVLRYIIWRVETRSDHVAIGVLDQAGIIDFNLAQSQSAGNPNSGSVKNPVSIRPYSNLDNAIQDLRNANLDLLCVVEPDFMQQGKVKLYTRDLWVGGTPPGIATFRDLLRASLLQRVAMESPHDEVKKEQVERRVLNPVTLSKLALTDDGTLVTVDSNWKILARFLVPYGMILLLTLSLFMSTHYLLQATVEEKENRAIEIMLSSVKPRELMWGKILGLGGAVLLQSSTFIALRGVMILYSGEPLSVNAGVLVLSMAYCLLGYLLYAGLLTGIGILSGNVHRNSQLITPLMMIVAIPVMLEFILIEAPNGAAARTLSYIPLTAPLTMVYRLALTNVPVIDIVISLSLIIGSAYLTVRGAAKMFRVAALMYGKRITGPEVIKWLRNA